MSDSKSSHISVCIATYRRPIMLGRCLEALTNLQTKGFTYSIIVVDNDEEQSARDIVNKWQKHSPVDICYDVEPEQNISRCRNKAVANSSGDLIAFIDDDEFPEPTWLLKLFLTLQQCNSDVVLGPVVPHFEVEPPSWIQKGRICERTRFTTGTVIHNARDTRTGNVLISRAALKGLEGPFAHVFGRSGGEDVDLFARILRNGGRIVWCDEAPVFETVPPERFSRKYYLKRALLRGHLNAEKNKLLCLGTLKSITAITLYTVMLPFLALLGQHWFMKLLIRYFDHVGKLISLCGYKPVRERNF